MLLAVQRSVMEVGRVGVNSVFFRLLECIWLFSSARVIFYYLSSLYTSFLFFCKLTMSLTREILEEILDKMLSSLQSSLDFLSAQYDSLLKAFKEQESKMKELSSVNSLLKAEIC